MRHLRLWSSAIVLLLALALSAIGDDKPTAPAKPAAEPKHRSRESAVARALKNARDMDSEHMDRVTVLPSTALDDPTYIVLIEFVSGTMVVFQGGADPDNDQQIVFEKRSLKPLEEAAFRRR